MNAERPSTVPPTTLLRLDGSDALEVLHRVSTQHLRDLRPGRCRPTLFCDFRGRLLHRAIVAVASADAVWLLRDDAPAGPLAGFLERQIFRERVRIEDRSGAGIVVAVPGDGGAAPEEFAERDGLPAHLQPDARWGYRVLPEASERDHEDRAPAHASIELDRIRAGRPRHGNEIHEAFNPFEVGIASEVHLDKGCFTGQEALLRMLTYGGVRRALYTAAGHGPPPASHAPLRSGNDLVGVVTSAIADGDEWVGLAVLRRSAPGGPLRLDDGRELARTEAFPETRPLGLPEPTR